ncbi:MAG: hypothetical protein WC755_00630 [Candidatus Woesearchaeota archaeon]|jgi:hypothetical protein
MDNEQFRKIVFEQINEISSRLISHSQISILSMRNNEWLEKLKNATEIPVYLTDEQKIAEYTQFLYIVLKNVFIETRDSRRNYFFNLTKNYFEMIKFLSFDKQLLFLNILDSLSENEVIFLISFYNRNTNPTESIYDVEYTDIRERLASKGVITKEIKHMTSSFKIINLQMKKNFEKIIFEINKIRGNNDSYFDINYEEKFSPARDCPVIVYIESDLGIQFISFLMGNTSAFENNHVKIKI